MKKYTEEEWNRLSKKEKSKAKEKAGLFAASAGILLFWSELTKSAKWSVFRWWVLYAAFMGSGLFTTYREITGSYSGRLEGYWKTHDDNGFAIFILIVIGITIFYIYRNNFFKSRTNHKKLSTIPLIIFFFSSIAISQLGRYHIYKQKVPGQKMEVYYTNPLSFFQGNYSSENQLEESSPISDEGVSFVLDAQGNLIYKQDIKEIIPEPSTYIEPVNPVPNYDDPGGVSENIIDISEYEEEVEIEEIEMEKVEEETIIDITEYEGEVIIEEIEIVEIEEDVEVPFAVVENVPVFPGCESDNNSKKRCFSERIAKFVQRKFNTELGADLGLSGRQRVNVIFKIDKTGNVIDIRARAPHPRLEKEAIRVVNLLPKMQPGKQRGKAVIVPYSLPIIFQVQD